MIGKSFGELKLQRKDYEKSIASMNNTVQIREQEVVVNPLQMLNRMLVIFESSRELGDFMKRVSCVNLSKMLYLVLYVMFHHVWENINTL